jgi:integrase
VRRGIWRPDVQAEPEAPKVEPTFHEFASDWFDRHRDEWRDGTADDYQWALSYHLVPHFKDHRLSAITAEEVDLYKAMKLRVAKARREAIEADAPLRDDDGRVLRPLAPGGINKTITRLAQILGEAVEYGYLASNPAQGKRRRVKADKPRRSWVEPEQLMALLDGSDSWHRPVIATLAGAGLRVGEAVALDWRDVNLATGTLTVRESKTDAGAGRRVDLPTGLVEELAEWKARSPLAGQDEPVFVCRSRNDHHARQTKDNIGRRLKVAIKRANVQLTKVGIETISERVSPHSLRRTYASLRGAVRDDPVYIAEQLGHTDPRFTLSVYAKAAKRRERLSGDYREAFDRALQWAVMGRIAEPATVEVLDGSDAPTLERA